MEFNDILNEAFKISVNNKFMVIINDSLVKEMTYFDLGIFLNTNTEKIVKIEITIKD